MSTRKIAIELPVSPALTLGPQPFSTRRSCAYKTLSRRFHVFGEHGSETVAVPTSNDCHWERCGCLLEPYACTSLVAFVLPEGPTAPLFSLCLGYRYNLAPPRVGQSCGQGSTDTLAAAQALITWVNTRFLYTMLTSRCAFRPLFSLFYPPFFNPRAGLTAPRTRCRYIH